MGQDVKFWEAVRKICQTDGRYKPEAFKFVMESLDFTLRSLEEHRHITAQELLQGMSGFAKSRYGLLAHTVLSKWGVESSSDVGRIVYHLVEAGVLKKQDSDRYEDFDNGYDLKSILEDNYFD
jgi:uncharacterized repeat protein (TIGR04138 family)